MIFASTPKPKPKSYSPTRPPLAGLHLAMSADSAQIVLRHIALRKTTLEVDSLTIIESDSVRVFGEAAYVQVQITGGKVRTIVINFHPLSGEKYINTRNTLNSYLERFFGRGVITQNESVTYRRWENEDGTMEVSYTDKYMRVFVRLGKR
ncbi:MAG: hypothetical protein Q8896_08015 [Bacteroidota bacterium]|nr:hypothetical protein [Bacteroidota bacterium]MDP4235755.1 hypothetical protein [Bacteroidota bacterium]